MLPKENENRQKISERCEQVFQASANLIVQAVAVESELRKRLETSPVQKFVAACLGLLKLSIRRFRSIELLCEVGHLDDADVLNRSLFESALAIKFILYRQKAHRHCSSKLRETLLSLPAIPRKANRREFRAELYAASETVRLEQLMRGWKTTKGTKRLFVNTQVKQLEDAVSDIEETIGAAWLRSIRKTRSYSGIGGINLLAECYGMQQHYETLYRYQSIKTHAKDGLGQIGPQGVDQLPYVIQIAGGILGGHVLKDIDSGFSLGLEAQFAKVS